MYQLYNLDLQNTFDSKPLSCSWDLKCNDFLLLQFIFHYVTTTLQKRKIQKNPLNQAEKAGAFPGVYLRWQAYVMQMVALQGTEGGKGKQKVVHTRWLGWEDVVLIVVQN